jgi:hypothetical protein
VVCQWLGGIFEAQFNLSDTQYANQSVARWNWTMVCESADCQWRGLPLRVQVLCKTRRPRAGRTPGLGCAARRRMPPSATATCPIKTKLLKFSAISTAAHCQWQRRLGLGRSRAAGDSERGHWQTPGPTRIDHFRLGKLAPGGGRGRGLSVGAPRPDRDGRASRFPRPGRGLPLSGAAH